MLTLDEIRQKYPANAKLSDEKLVGKLYNTYGNDVDEIDFYKQFGTKPPVQTEKIKEDLFGAPGRAWDLAGDVIKETPEAIENFGSAVQYFDKKPIRAAQNLAGGFLEGVGDLRHLPEEIGKYAESRGLIKENKAPVFSKSDWGSFIKPEDENEFDKTFQSLGNFGGILKASKILGKLIGPANAVSKEAKLAEKVGHTAKEAGRDVLQYGAPISVQAASHGEDPLAALLMPGVLKSGSAAIREAAGAGSQYITKPLKAQRSAAKETKGLQEKVTEKERQAKRHTEGEQALQGAEKQFKEERERAKSAFGHQVGQERAKAQETLETTGGYLEGERAAPRMQAKEDIVNAVREEHAKIRQEEAKNYEPFNKGGKAAKTIVSEEHQEPYKVSKVLSDTTTAPLLQKVSRKVDLWNSWEDASIETATLDQKANKIYGEMKRKGWENVTDSEREKYAELTKQYKESKKLEESLKKEWDKTSEPTAQNWIDIYKESRDEAYHIDRQMKSENITSQELKSLKSKRDALKNVRENARNKIKTVLSPEHYSQFEEANLHHQKYVSPFQNSPFLKNLIEGEGKVTSENFHNKASSEKARHLIDRLYKNQKIKSKVVAHDLKTLNIDQPKAISEFLHEHSKGLGNEVKTQLQNRTEALVKEKELAKLEAAMHKTEARLLAQSPNIAKLIENNPSLKKLFEQIGKEQKTLVTIREQLTKLGIEKDVINREINAYKENMEDLKVDAEKWENKKKFMKGLPKKATMFGVGTGALFKFFGG